MLRKAQNSLVSAKILLAESQEENAYELAYEAMLSAGRALVFSCGLRPRTQGSHKIVIEFAALVLENNFDILIKKFDRMRKTRHYLIYGAGFSISVIEAENAVKNAGEFIEKVSAIIKEQNPQKELFDV
ncbi:MAG: HEPN domain-containing protein [Candidatus Falkowbacteria bacterium]